MSTQPTAGTLPPPPTLALRSSHRVLQARKLRPKRNTASISHFTLRSSQPPSDGRKHCNHVRSTHGETESRRGRAWPEAPAGRAQSGTRMQGRGCRAGSDSPGKQPQLTKRGLHQHYLGAVRRPVPEVSTAQCPPALSRVFLQSHACVPTPAAAGVCLRPEPACG